MSSEYVVGIAVVVLVAVFAISVIRQHRITPTASPVQPPAPPQPRSAPRIATPPPAADHPDGPVVEEEDADTAAHDEAAEEPDPDEPKSNLVEGEVMPAGISELVLNIDNADVTITRVEGLDGIHFASNTPKRFAAKNGTIKQTGSSWSTTHELSVRVPHDFKGGLRLITQNSTSIKLDRWSQGVVTIDHSSDAQVTIGDLDGILALFIDAAGDGAITLGAIRGTTGIIRMKGDGDLTTGGITMSGLLAINLDDDGNATVQGAVKADTFILTQCNNGAFKGADIICNRYVKIDNRDDGGATMGDITAPRVHLICQDDGDVVARHVRAEGGAVIIDTGRAQYDDGPEGTMTLASVTGGSLNTNMFGQGDLSITGGVKLTGLFDFKSGDVGNAKIAGVEALGASVTLDHEGNANLGDLTVQQGVDVLQTNLGSVEMHMLTAENFTGSIEGDGAFDITGKATVAKHFALNSFGDGESNIASCDCKTMSLINGENCGAINVKGGTAECAFVNQYGADITLAHTFTNVHYVPQKEEDE